MQPGGNSGGLMAVAILAIILGTLAVALRLYTRKVVLNQIWVDDYLACASWVRRGDTEASSNYTLVLLHGIAKLTSSAAQICLMALVVQNFHNISTGLGSHFADIPPQTLPRFYLVCWLSMLEIASRTLSQTSRLIHFAVGPVDWPLDLPGDTALHEVYPLLPILPNHTANKLAASKDILCCTHVDHRSVAGWPSVHPAFCLHSCGQVMG